MSGFPTDPRDQDLLTRLQALPLAEPGPDCNRRIADRVLEARLRRLPLVDAPSGAVPGGARSYPARSGLPWRSMLMATAALLAVALALRWRVDDPAALGPAVPADDEPTTASVADQFNFTYQLNTDTTPRHVVGVVGDGEQGWQVYQQHNEHVYTWVDGERGELLVLRLPASRAIYVPIQFH